MDRNLPGIKAARTKPLYQQQTQRGGRWNTERTQWGMQRGSRGGVERLKHRRKLTDRGKVPNLTTSSTRINMGTDHKYMKDQK